MKVMYKEKIGDHVIVRFLSDATVDSVATKKKIAPMVTDKMTEEEVENLFMENLVYAQVGPEAELIEDEEAKSLQMELAEMGEHRLMLDNGEYIDDYRGVEYFIKKSGKWKKEKIEEIGIPLPASAILQDKLTEAQQKEISTQQEAQRIAGLTDEQKIEEKNSRLKALAREINQKAEDAELMGETFDRQSLYQQKKTAIDDLYA